MARKSPNRLHGYLVIDKPAGWTSHDVVGRVRRLTGERKVGHAGTLDPAATGVLPVAVGSATRLLEFLSESSKTYLAEITFGVSTDSHDADGIVIGVAPADVVTREGVEQALTTLRGDVRQVPPAHSAIQIGGRRAYDLVRKGQTVELDARTISIHELALVDWASPVATVCIDCSKGTYVRAIARDLGELLGCGAHLSNLVRLRTGPFTLDDAWSLSELESIDTAGDWERIAAHPDAGAESLDAIVIDMDSVGAWRQGKPVWSDRSAPGFVRVYDADGSWLGIAAGDAENGCWRPNKVVDHAA